MTNKHSKNYIRHKIRRLLKKYQVDNQPCQIESCSSKGLPTLIPQSQESKEPTQESYSKTEVYFLCKSHKSKYSYLMSDRASEVDKNDPLYEKFQNLSPVSLKEVLSKGSPLEASTQALRQRLYKYLEKQGLNSKNVLCAVTNCTDKAQLFIPSYDNPFIINPVCTYHKNTEEGNTHTINVKDPDELEILQSLNQDYKNEYLK